jgi:heme-degrading monooxygenase HmoA
MFTVLFEIHPKSDQFNVYLDYAKMLAPELKRIDGFIGVVRYRSLTREGWLLSLSSWHDEDAIARWRKAPMHRDVQAKGRSEVFLDYRIRVGQLTRDSQLPDADTLHHRLDLAETASASAATLVDSKQPTEWVQHSSPQDVAKWLGADLNSDGLVAWDVFEAVLTPGDIILVISWRDEVAADSFEGRFSFQNGRRLRRVSVVRDYGRFDRREAPQQLADVECAAEIGQSGVAADKADRAVVYNPGIKSGH